MQWEGPPRVAASLATLNGPPYMRFFSFLLIAISIHTTSSAEDISSQKIVASDEHRLATIDDMLMVEELGLVHASNGGDIVVYERTPQYRYRVDYGVPRSAPGRHVSEIFYFKTNNRRKGRLLFEPEPNTGYWLPEENAFSPNDRYIALYSVSNGRVKLRIYDFLRRRLLDTGYTPELNTFGTNRPRWINSETIMFSTAERGKLPFHVSFRRHMAAEFSEAWTRTFEGNEPSVRDISTMGAEKREGHFSENSQLITYNAKSGVVETISDRQHLNVLNSPSGKYFSAIRASDRPASQPDEDWSVWRRSELRIYDFVNKRWIDPSPDLDVFAETILWDADHDKLVFFGWPVGQSVRELGAYYVFDSKCECTTKIDHSGLELASQREWKGWGESPERPVWLNGELAILARPLSHSAAPGTFTYRGYILSDPRQWPSNDPIWHIYKGAGVWEPISDPIVMVSRDVVGVSGNKVYVLQEGKLVGYSVDGEKVSIDVGDGTMLRHNALNVTEHAPTNDPYKDKLILEYTSDSEEGVIFISLDNSREISRVSMEELNTGARLVGNSVSAEQAIYKTFENGVAELISTDSKQKTVTRDKINEHFSDVVTSEWRHISYEATSNAETLVSCILLPPNYEIGKKYPAIIQVYPSYDRSDCRKEDRNDFFRVAGNSYIDVGLDDHLLAANGFIVVRAVSPESLQRTESGNFSGLTQLAIDAADALVKQGYSGAEQIGLLGRSQGGAAALWVASQTDRFATVVSIVGWADYWSHFFQIDAYSALYHDQYPFGVRSGRYVSNHGPYGLGGTPWDHPDTYIKSSPLYHAENIDSPVLLINSDMDFPISQYEQMFNALKYHDKDARLLTYWGESHVFASPANLYHVWSEVLEWYGTKLRSEASQGVEN